VINNYCNKIYAFIKYYFRMKRVIIVFSLIFLVFPVSAQTLYITSNKVIEWQYMSDQKYSDPFNDVAVFAEIKLPDGHMFVLPGFWAGDDVWKFRFSSLTPGEYSFTTKCSDTLNKALHGQKGMIHITSYEGTNTLYTHGSIHVSANKKYLQHQDGTPFFWLADSWWHGMTSRFRWPYDFKYLSRERKDKGFTVIQFAIGFPCDIEPFDPRGQNEAGDPWDKEWKSIRPEYFDLADLRVRHLVEQGLVPNIVGSWGYYIKWAGVETMKKHWNYLIARYGAYPVTWTLAGEVTLAWYHDLATQWEEEKSVFREQWSDVAAYIKQNDPYQHLLTVHPGPNSGDLKPINRMELIDMVMCQSGHEGYYTFERSVDFIKKAQHLYPDKPVLHGEVCFEGMDGKSWQDVQRFLFWSNSLMGTPGFSYGAEGIWQFNSEEELFGPSPAGNVWGNVPWEIAHKYEGSREIGLGKKFLDHYQWWRLTPAQDRIESRENGVVSIPFCAAIEDDHLIIYMFRKPVRWRKYGVNGLEPGKTYSVVWFDPIQGNVIENDAFTANSEGIIDIDYAPIMQDWVLVINLKED
jgi:hypothetical protein